MTILKKFRIIVVIIPAGSTGNNGVGSVIEWQEGDNIVF